jgi:NAD-dependent deacetylase
MINDRSIIEKFIKPNKVVVLTGAGISAASGIPTFRGKEGLWKNYSPHELATPQAFTTQPNLVWEWYLWRRDLIRKVKPNPAHIALVELEKINPNYTLITQNVDNLHQEAGSKQVIELHGNIMKNICFDCSNPVTMEISFEDGIPQCLECGGLIRPGVVWFGEMLPYQALHNAQQAANECHLCLSIGTSGVVEPAASIPFMARGNGAYLIEINPEETPLTAHSDLFLQESADKILPDIIQQIKSILNV